MNNCKDCRVETKRLEFVRSGKLVQAFRKCKVKCSKHINSHEKREGKSYETKIREGRACWVCMKKRCLNEKDKSFKRYGAKGIGIDSAWLDYDNFLKDMGPRPSTSHSIDRIDNKKGYFKENCRWATAAEQNNNRTLTGFCYQGHRWTDQNTIWIHNGKRKARRCKICLEKRLGIKNES